MVGSAPGAAPQSTYSGRVRVFPPPILSPQGRAAKQMVSPELLLSHRDQGFLQEGDPCIIPPDYSAVAAGLAFAVVPGFQGSASSDPVLSGSEHLHKRSRGPLKRKGLILWPIYFSV